MSLAALPRARAELQPGQIVPTWVPSPSGALSTIVHLPHSDRARGAVITLPSLGASQNDAFPGLSELSDGLARAGYVVLCADWSGTGESATPDPTSTPSTGRWLDDVAALAHYARETLHQDSVSLVAWELGAMIAALAAGDPVSRRWAQPGRSPYSSVVLIDPPATGVEWLQDRLPGHTRALAGSGSGVAISGIQQSDIEAIARLSLPTGRSDMAQDTRFLVVTRPDEELAPGLSRYIDGVGALTRPSPALIREPGQESKAVVTHSTWSAIDGWITAEPLAESVAPRFDPVRSARVTPAGVEEEYVDVQGLPGVLTRPLGPPRGALVLLPPVGAHRVGPVGHGWVKLARNAAEHGIATLRLDYGVAGGKAAVVVTDVEYDRGAGVKANIAAAEWLAERTGRTPVIVGLGASGWGALQAARWAPVSRVVSLAQDDWSTMPLDLLDPTAPRQIQPPPAPRSWKQRLWSWFAAIADPPGYARPYEPPHQTPHPLLEGATRRGIACDLFLTQSGAEEFRRAYGHDAVRVLQGQGAEVTMRVVSWSDQRLLEPTALEDALDYILDCTLATRGEPRIGMDRLPPVFPGPPYSSPPAGGLPPMLGLPGPPS
ncbi:alpha/beta fold hydrolase [Austwickia chelonae]|uniref:alpha/beta fold hydrolase n=1 Tax=Austwickia chelonae TaxID=100225 RepID=UPI000E25E4B2|nr:alpha/beta fold hydrolase [Austwickia chelonae]